MTKNKQTTKSYQVFSQTVGEKMRNIRKLKNLTLNQVSKFLEITPQQLQKYETNYTEIPFNKLYMFIETFKLNPEYFFSDDNKSKNGF